jgi:hypothetical protein
MMGWRQAADFAAMKTARNNERVWGLDLIKNNS